MREQCYFWDARLPMCTPLAVDLTSLTSCLPLLSFRSCEISCTWKCLTAWRTKRNPQLPHWGWTVTTVILQHSTTAPNHSPWPPKRRIRKPGFALSSQEEGIKVKYQGPGIQKGPVSSFFVAFLSWVVSCFWALVVQGLFDLYICIFRGCLLSEDHVWLMSYGIPENIHAVFAFHINWIYRLHWREAIIRVLSVKTATCFLEI